MRNIAAVSVVAFALNCWTVGAWAQSVASNVAAPKVEDAVNVWGFNANYKQTLDAGSTKKSALTNDLKIRPGSGATVDSTTRALPESARNSAKNLTIDVVSRIAGLQQTKIPGQVSASAYDAENTLSKNDDLYRR
jgi:hypothetical protein